MPPELLQLLAEMFPSEGGSNNGFDPYQQPAMGMGYGPSFGAGAATRAAGMDQYAGHVGYRGPARGLPPAVPGPQTQEPMLGGLGYGAARGAQLPPGILAMLLYQQMRRGGQ